MTHSVVLFDQVCDFRYCKMFSSYAYPCPKVLHSILLPYKNLITLIRIYFLVIVEVTIHGGRAGVQKK